MAQGLLCRVRRIWPVLVILLLPVVLLSPSLFGGRATTTDDVLLFSPPWSVDLAAVHIVPQNPILSDVALQISPWLFFTRQSFLSGHLPLWDPYVAGGTPFLAAALPGVFYPLTWLEVALPYPFGITIVTLLKWWMAGLGMFVFARASLRMARAPALVAALTFMYSSFVICWLLFEIAQVAVLQPWTFWATERIIHSPSIRRVVLLALITLLVVLAGQPEISFHVLLGAALYALWLVGAQLPLPVLMRLRRLGYWAGGIVLGLALAAIQLLPTLTLLPDSFAERIRVQVGPEQPLPIAGLATWLVPNLFGNPALTLQPWALITNKLPLVSYNEYVFYAGAVALVLALVALRALRKRERRATVAFFAAMTCFFIALLYGFPLVSWVTALPVIRSDIWTRLGGLAIFGIAVLAGLGYEEMLTWPAGSITPGSVQAGQAGSQPRARPLWDRRNLPGLLGWLALLPLLFLIIDLLGQRLNFTPDHVQWIVFWLDVAAMLIWATALLLLMRWQGWLSRRLVSTALLGLLLGDLLLFAVPYVPQPPASLAYPQIPTITRLQQTIGSARMIAAGAILLPDSGIPYQLHDLRGYELAASARYMEYMEAVDPLLKQTPYLCCRLFGCPSPTLLSAASVAYYATLPDFDANRCAPLAAGQAPAAGPFVPLWTQGGITLWRNTQARPRFYFAAQVIPSASEQQTLAALPRLSPDGRDAIIEGAAGTSISTSAAVRDAGGISILADQSGEMTLRTQSTAAEWLIVNEGYDPGWSAEIDGAAQTIHPANEMFMALFVPAGSHSIHLLYRPASFIVGAWLSALALLILLCLLPGAWVLRHRRVV